MESVTYQPKKGFTHFNTAIYQRLLFIKYPERQCAGETTLSPENQIQS